MLDPPAPPPDEKSLTLQAMAANLGVHRTTLYRAIKARRLPSVRIAKRARYFPSQVRWALQLENSPARS